MLNNGNGEGNLAVFIQRKFEVAFSTPEKYTVKKEKGDCLGIFTYR